MIVRKLRAVNIKKIKDVTIEPPEHVVLICGKNGQGKTSLMDCLTYALGGKKFIDDKPIRDGEKEAEIELDLGDYIIKRTFTEKDTYLTVKTKEGAVFQNGQNKLDELGRTLYFDPMKFADMNTKEQKETLLKLIGVDIVDDEVKYKVVFDERTMIGRQRDDAKGELNSIVKPDKKYFELKETSVVDLIEKQTKLNQINYDIGRCTTEISEAEFEINRLKGLIKTEEENIKNATNTQQELIKNNPDIAKEILDVKFKIDNLDVENSNIRNASKYIEADIKVKDYTEKYDSKTKELEAINQVKNDKLSTAKMPIEGLGINDTGITFNEIPFDQLATSEKMKVALSIAMAGNTELRIIRILDGSLLDSDNMNVITEMAEKSNYQVFIERVEENSEAGFVIEDGELKK